MTSNPKDTAPDFADFDNYRHLRDHEDGIASMVSPIPEGLLLPVLDCDSFQLVRLHVFENADNQQRVDAFEAEMERVSKLDERLVSAPFKWGIDPGENKIFYLNQFLEGQPLNDYLDQVGQISVGTAALWLIPFVRIAERLKQQTPHIRKNNLFVARNLSSNLPELHLTDFTSWLYPNDTDDRSIDYHLGQIFLSMISGVSSREFDSECMPKQTYPLSESHQEVIQKTFTSKPGENEQDFFQVIRQIAEASELTIPDLPRSSLQHWLQSELDNLPDQLVLDPDQEPEENFTDLFLVPSEHEGLPCSIQIFPGKKSIERDWFFNQHFKILDRDRNSANQLAVYDFTENDSITTITEEDPVGFHLEQIFQEVGKLDLEHAIAMTDRLSSALGGLETTSGSTPIWYIPAHSIYVVWIDYEVENFIKAMDYEGPEIWSRVSFRLRLHLTTVDLLTGIEMPNSLRQLSDQPSDSKTHVRRTAILLPLVSRALSGKKLDWNHSISIEEDYVPEDVANFLNSTRETLLNRPLELEEGFVKEINKFAELDSDENSEFATKHDKNDEFREILSDRLGTDKINLATGKPDDDDTEELYQELAALEAEETRQEPEIVDSYRDGEGYGPATEKENKSQQEREAKKEELRRRIEEREHERKVASRQMLGLDNEIATPPERRKSGFGWVLVFGTLALAAILGAAYFLNERTKNPTSSTEEVAEFKFPKTYYDVVTPEVDPFTDLVPSVIPRIPETPKSIAASINDMALAISRSTNSVQTRAYNDAVEYALKAIEIAPESTTAADQLEFVLRSWIRSGSNNSDESESPDVIAEYHIKGSGRSDVEKGVPQGLYLLMNAATKKGDTRAMRILGLLFGQGKLVPKSTPIAMKWLQKAAELDDLEAQFYLGESSVFGTMIPSNKEGFVFLEKAAKAGHPRSLLFRGYCKVEGFGVPVDYEKGFADIANAASRGSLEAVFLMGLCQTHGIGIEKSESMATYSFRSAAELGYVPSMFFYAHCLIGGIGIDASQEEGVSWMKKAATAGYFEAQEWCQRNKISYKGEPEKKQPRPKAETAEPKKEPQPLNQNSEEEKKQIPEKEENVQFF